MKPEVIFEFASLIAIAGWVLLVIALLLRPGVARNALLFTAGRVAPLLLCLIYLVVLVSYWGSAPGGSFGSLEGVAQLFAPRGKLLGGWIHFLAFDLFVGRWIVDDIDRKGGARWSLILSVPLTFLFGPLGLLLHFALHGRGRQDQAAA